jgi:3-isopropylmalate dehydratase small subunit
MASPVRAFRWDRHGEKGYTLSIDFENRIVTHESNEYHFPALPKEVLAILEDGGLIPYVRKALGKG